MAVPEDMIELRAEGLYCPAGDFHIDPWLPVPRAVVTHAHADHARSGSGLYHCHVQSAPLLRLRLDAQPPLVMHDYGDPFAFGPARVSLHPAGHILGSAQVRVEVDGRVWVLSGDYKRDPDPTCAPFEVQRCDTFITEATFGLPVYRWPDPREVAADILQWWDGCRSDGDAAVLYCYALGKAQRILAELSRLADRRVLLHGAMTRLVEIYREAGVAMLPTDTVMDQGKSADFAGELILAPPSAAGSPWMRRFRNASTGFASGWMQLRGNRRRRGYDRGFVVSDHADWPDLLRTIEETGARRVLATHGNTEALVQTLLERGVAAETLRTQFGGDD
jgi:putative mRNA 3-end processing factor